MLGLMNWGIICGESLIGGPIDSDIVCEDSLFKGPNCKSDTL